MATGPTLTSRDWAREVTLEFDAFRRVDDYISEFIVMASGDGLSVRVPVIYGPGARELSDYLLDLSKDFRGWPGVRSWRSLEDQLRIDAIWQSGGHAELLFHLTPSVYDKWTVAVSVTLEVGEELHRLASELGAFMTA